MWLSVGEATEVPVWRRMQHWVALSLRGYVSVMGMSAIVTLGVYVSATIGSITIAYVFFASGMGFLGVNLSVRGVEFYQMPVRLGYDASALYLEFRHKKSRRLAFEYLADLSLACYASGWYLELETIEGEHLTAGADPTPKFGKGLLESFARSRESSGRCRTTVEMRMGFYPSRRIFVSIHEV